MSHGVPNLEELFTHPDFWGVETATPVQRAFLRVAEGRPLGDLACDDDVRWAVGGDEALAFLAPGGSAPKQVSLYGAVRVGKSDLASCIAFRGSQTLGMELVRGHEVPRIPIVSLTADLGRVTFGHLLGRLHQPALAPLLVSEGKEHVIVRHPSGADVEIRVVAGGGAKAGGALISRWVGGVVFDEKPRMQGSDDGTVVNYPDALAAVEGRLLDGAQIIDLGSPWAPWGPAWDDVQERWGKPTREHVVMRVRGPMGNPRWWTPARCAALQAKNARSYQTECLGEFTDSGGSMVPAEHVDAATVRPMPGAMRGGVPAICVDLSTLEVGGDETGVALVRWLHPMPEAERPQLFMHATRNRGLVREDEIRPDDEITIRDVTPARGADDRILQHAPATQPIFEVMQIHGFRSTRERRYTLGEIADFVVRLAREANTTTVILDQFENASFRQLLIDREPRLQPKVIFWTGGEKAVGAKAPAIERLRRMLVEGTILLPPDPQLRNELVQYRRVTTTTGERFEPGRGVSHGDRASAVITSLMADLAGMLDASPLAKRNGVGFADPYSPNEMDIP